MKKPVSFYSEGCRLVGDVYYPDGPGRNAPRAGIVLCHGYTGVKDIYLPDNARVLTEAGYVALTFDATVKICRNSSRVRNPGGFCPLLGGRERPRNPAPSKNR